MTSCDPGLCTLDRRQGEWHNLTKPSCRAGTKWVPCDVGRRVRELKAGWGAEGQGRHADRSWKLRSLQAKGGSGHKAFRQSAMQRCSGAAEPVLPGRPTSMSTSHWLHATPDEGTTTLLMPLCTAACKQGQFGWGTIRHKALIRQDRCQMNTCLVPLMLPCEAD